MTKILMPTPDVPNRSLAGMLPTLREMLEEQREFRLEQLEDLAGQSDLWYVDVGTDRGPDPRGAVAAALTDGARRALSDIQTALARMDAGRYGRCLRCSGEISVERLSVIPATSLCVNCQRRTNQRR